jgi:hypothetical protein
LPGATMARATSASDWVMGNFSLSSYGALRVRDP